MAIFGCNEITNRYFYVVNK